MPCGSSSIGGDVVFYLSVRVVEVQRHADQEVEHDLAVDKEAVECFAQVLYAATAQGNDEGRQG